MEEAHRSQYDFFDGFARHMRDALPNASFIAFTGTPLELQDRNTRQVFGDYISIYDIQRAVEDQATVPIYYEARLAKLDLPEELKPKIDEEFEEVTEGEEVERKERLKTKWAQLEAVVGAEKRLGLIAQDIVEHFERRLEALDGKAMVVCMSRRICVNLYREIVRLRPQWHQDDHDKGVIKVVMTGSASDPPAWHPHIRNKPRRELLARRFRDPTDPHKLVIVRDMWLTGFDCPSLHTMYLDKPMRGHGLMQAIARFARPARQRLPHVDAAQPERVLENLGLVYEGKLNNAGILLFARRPQRLFPLAQVRIGIFHGTQILDSHGFQGTLWQQLDGAMKRFRQLLKVRFDIRVEEPSLEGLQRREVWEYPLEALREAVANALIHRDYTYPADIQIRLEENRLEVWSPGELPPPLTPQALYGPHASVLRNPLIAQAFYFAGIIERWGSGTTRIVDLCMEQDLPQPEFANWQGGVRVVFFKDPYTPERLRAMGLSERQIKAVLYVKERGAIGNKEYQQLPGVWKPTVTRDLEGLVECEVLVREGGRGRGTSYTLKGSQWAQKGLMRFGMRAINFLGPLRPGYRNGPRQTNEELAMPQQRRNSRRKGTGRTRMAPQMGQKDQKGATEQRDRPESGRRMG